MQKIIRIDGEIGDWGNTAEDFNLQLDEIALQPSDDLLVKINSVGGSVIEGWAIYNILKGLDNKVTTRGEGIVASIASLILMAGDVKEMSEVGSLMIHRASNFVQGNAEDLEKAAETLKTIDDTLLVVYNAATNDDVTNEQITEWLDAETWFSTSEAKDHGFIDEVVNKAEVTVSAIYKPKINKQMKLAEQVTKIVNQITGEQQKQDEAKKAEEDAALKAEEEAKEKAEEEANADKPEYVEAEVMAQVLEALGKINERLNAIENPAESLEKVVEDKVKSLLKAVKSKGGSPEANGDLNNLKGTEYQPKHANLTEKLREIGEKTKPQIN